MNCNKRRMGKTETAKITGFDNIANRDKPHFVKMYLRWLVLNKIALPAKYRLFGIPPPPVFDGVIINYKDRKVLLESGGLLNCADETFIKEEYKKLNVKDRVVVDIGSNIGDTAIYFSIKCARKVYAFEPFPYAYKLAVRNLAANKIKNIVLVNAGLGRKNETIRINAGYKSRVGEPANDFGAGKKIRLFTLSEVADMCGARGDAVIKLDCEGAEYECIIGSSDETLQRFKEFILEYHYGYINLTRKLENAGFKVELITRPSYNFNIDAKDPNTIFGILYARRDG